MDISLHKWTLFLPHFLFLVLLSQTLPITIPTHFTTMAVSTSSFSASPSSHSSSTPSHHRHHHPRSRSLPPSNSTLLTPPPPTTHHIPQIPTMTPTHPPPPPPSQHAINIIDTLIGSGDFGDWVRIISGASPLFLPLSTTLFIPQDTDQNRPVVSDPFVFPYHVIPQRLTFSELLLLKIKSRIPTLLPGRSIIITNNSRFNFTVDEIPITQPDVYLTGSVAVHRISGLLDYNAFGNGLDVFPKPSQQNQTQLGSQPPSNGGTFWRSEASISRAYVVFEVAFLAVFISLFLLKNLGFDSFLYFLILRYCIVCVG